MMWTVVVVIVVGVLIGSSLVVGALIERHTNIVARLDGIDLEPADSPDEVEIGTWDHHTETALELVRDADAEQWDEAGRRLAPDHGYGPAPQGPSMAVYPRRTK